VAIVKRGPNNGTRGESAGRLDQIVNVLEREVFGESLMNVRVVVSKWNECVV